MKANIAIAMGLSLLLAGCASPMAGNRPAAEPYPDDYEAIARTVLAARGAKGDVTISTPRQTHGWSASDPDVWYVCVSGLEARYGWKRDHPNASPERLAAYQIAIAMAGRRSIGVIEDTPVPLCEGAEFRQITL